MYNYFSLNHGIQDHKNNVIVLSVTNSLFKMMAYVIKFQHTAISIRLMKTNYEYFQSHSEYQFSNLSAIYLKIYLYISTDFL